MGPVSLRTSAAPDECRDECEYEDEQRIQEDDLEDRHLGGLLVEERDVALEIESHQACEKCNAELIDADAKLKQAKLSKNSHVLTPDKITFEERKDKNLVPYLEIRYYDFDAQYISEAHFFSNESSIKKFNINFLRSHLKRPELAVELSTPQEVIKYQRLFRMPAFVIARKQDKFWKITEKVFAEEL